VKDKKNAKKSHFMQRFDEFLHLYSRGADNLLKKRARPVKLFQKGKEIVKIIYINNLIK